MMSKENIRMVARNSNLNEDLGRVNIFLKQFLKKDESTPPINLTPPPHTG